ncbi:SMP-30/gluconolactonase/LRE family protein [Pelagicoccus mobilis]|uniref:SMP-30/gluconolactonase/LRE family protein n=1 Tax=Pelagicoccus mobilis TaxID=415221 RepID=A0A934VTM5_9BACT|nr:SMP-30/gluconolactonase/LRE family protein [Pelagicoccus mobilis]MBK1879878.1 SMP-30/gluconolactonase/LRE family protein [Pelagicoccus mobilis]
MKRIKHLTLVLSIAACSALPPALHAQTPAKLFAELPEYCPTPDALAVAPDGSITLSCPNYAKGGFPGILVSISKDGTVSKLADVPGANGKASARPMGIAYAPDGSLFVNANQGPHGRLLRMTFKNGQHEKTEVVAKGLNGPNGLRYKDGALYVTIAMMPKVETGKNTGGVYRFKETDRNIQVNNDLSDPNLIFTAETQNPKKQFGLDGLVFNKAGDLFVGDFGDGTIYRLTLKSDGTVASSEVYAQAPNTAGVDGIDIDEAGNLYLAGFSQNQILKVDTNKDVSVIAEYPDNNGANGELDQPADLMVHKGRLYISNFDLMVEAGMKNTGHSKPYTISVIDLSEVE